MRERKKERKKQQLINKLSLPLLNQVKRVALEGHVALDSLYLWMCDSDGGDGNDR